MILSMRQGDVLIKKVVNINLKKLKKVGKEEYTVALGEKSGHSHVIRGDVQVFKGNPHLLITVGEKGARLQHELVDGSWTKEHYPISLDAGIYEIVQQRESTLLDEIRLVKD